MNVAEIILTSIWSVFILPFLITLGLFVYFFDGVEDFRKYYIYFAIGLLFCMVDGHEDIFL